jgi:hypothetical protein
MADSSDTPDSPKAQDHALPASPVKTAFKWAFVVVLLVIIGFCARKIMRDLSPEPEPKRAPAHLPVAATKPAKPKAPAKPKTPPAASQPAQAQPANAADTLGTRQYIGSLSLQSPIPINPDPETQANLAKTKHEGFDSFEAFSSGFDPKRQINLSLVVLHLSPDTPFDLDAGAKGAIEKVALACGDQNPLINVKTLTIDGCPARKAEYVGSKDGKPFTLDGLLISKGQTVWMLQAISLDQNSRPVCQSLLSSVKIQAPPVPAPVQ